MRVIYPGAVILGLLIAAPQPSWAAPPRKSAVKKSPRKARVARKARATKASTVAVKKKKKKKERYVFGPIGVTAAPQAPQAVYVIPKAKVKYTRPAHEQEILGWIIRSMRSR